MTAIDHQFKIARPANLAVYEMALRDIVFYHNALLLTAAAGHPLAAMLQKIAPNMVNLPVEAMG